MALILRIDVDHAHGKQSLFRKVLSRVSSDYWLPRSLPGYLEDLGTVLEMLNERRIPAYVFYRRCTLPTPQVLALARSGGHRAGLHLEDSRSYETFLDELEILQNHIGERVETFSKHGSGVNRYGRHHYAPYEPENYLKWAETAGLTSFFGNLEDPAMPAEKRGAVTYFPSAFWLEPSWRDTNQYPITWLLENAPRRDITLLLHPSGVTCSREVMRDFLLVLDRIDVKLIEPSMPPHGQEKREGNPESPPLVLPA